MDIDRLIENLITLKKAIGSGTGTKIMIKCKPDMLLFSEDHEEVIFSSEIKRVGTNGHVITIQN